MIGEWSDSDIESLAQFVHEMSGVRDPWTDVPVDTRRDVIEHVRYHLTHRDMFGHIVRAAAGLLRRERARSTNDDGA